MSDAAATLYLLAGLLCALVMMRAARAVNAWRRLRGARLVTCPETDAPAAVMIDGTCAAINAVFDSPSLWLATCSRWPSRRFCGQACLPQVKAAPDDTLVRTIVGRRFADKTCVYCRKAITEARFVHHHPALLGHDGKTFEWTDVPPERLPALFRTHLPACWNCHVAETFRRTYPERVTDRSDARRL